MSEIGPDFRAWLEARDLNPAQVSKGRLRRLEWEYEEELSHDSQVEELMSAELQRPRPDLRGRRIPQPRAQK